MPRISKVNPASTKPKKPSMQDDTPEEFYCSRCKKKYKKQKSNFPASQSPLYKGNGGYLTHCYNCIEELFEHYEDVLNSEEEAIKRICLKFDIYWNKEIYSIACKSSATNARIRAYISKTNLYKYIGKTFDDTLDEMGSVVSYASNDIEAQFDGENVTVSNDIIEFWGAGFEPLFYLELDRKYKHWTKNLQLPLEESEEAIYKQICILEATINRDSAAGKPIEKNVNALNSLLGSANLKPSQKKQEDAVDTAFDKTPFGLGIRYFENSKPIPEPDPEFKDVDNIIKYISVWFLGHLCKMLGIKNTYCKLYEQELEKLRVDRPDLEDEDDEALFNDIFGEESQ